MPRSTERSERARERETHRYYQTWIESARGFMSPQNVSRDDSLEREDGTSPHQATQKISRDKALVAFAQLGCLRLNVKRGIVTLISSSTSYVLAEATRSISLLSGGQHAPGDELWFGTASLPRSQGVSEHALAPPLYTAKSPDRQYTAPALVINDMTLDARSSSKEYVGNGTSFYAGVPITTKNGFTIGVYTVTDDKVRDGLSIEELQFMQDIASTVMDHLQNIRNDTARHRGERMVLGLGAFTEGKATLDTDGDSSVSARETSIQSSRTSFNRSKFKGITITETDPDALRHTMNDGSSDLTPDDTPPESVPTPADNLLQDREFHIHSRELVSDSTASASGSKVRPLKNAITDAKLGNSPVSLADASQSSTPPEIRQTFARAANILRQCTASDGVMFFDAESANVGNGYRATRDIFNSNSNGSTSSEETMSSSGGSGDDLVDQRTGYFDRSSSEQKVNPHDHRKKTKLKKCELLGYSLRLNSMTKTKKFSSGLVLKEGEMRRFIRRYPKGLVMHFTKDGEISSSEDSSANEGVANTAMPPSSMTPSQKEKKHVIAKELIKVVPGARNVIWLPLWDFSKARWSAGCFVWSSRPEKLLNAQEDLVYMKAFANTVMNEINRLEAVVSDQAKTSFVANISHELRSPLHGILGSIEFLQETAVDPFQASMITTVETCGKTLLDTVNHVLEFAKLSKRFHKESLQVMGKESGIVFQSDLEMDVNLAIVVEEVVEAIYAGQTFRSTGAFHGGEEDDALPMSIEGTPPINTPLEKIRSKFSGAVRVVLDIERLDSWYVRTQPGAIRRIVMNLLGNALKYTGKGLVYVSLQSTEGRSRKRSGLSFCITVADTGKGMSTDFVRNHAWEAFSQEDSFASGVGLGLSIVRQITNSLGGKIELQSAKNKGTELKILLTIPHSLAPPDDSQNMIKAVAQRVHGLTLSILDPGHARSTGADADLNCRAEDSFRRLATAWFGMKVFRAAAILGTKADFFLYIEPPSADYMLQKHGVGTENPDVPLVVITSNAFEGTTLRKDTQRLKDLGRTIDIISQPVGPQKLARALERCLDRGPFTAPPDITSSSPATGANENVLVETDYTAKPGYLADFPSMFPPQAWPSKSARVNSESTMSQRSLDTPTEAKSVSVTVSSLSKFETTPQALSASSNDRDNSASEGFGKAPVLLVDDNEVNLKLLVAFVRKAKYPYETAEDGLQALNLYKEASRDPNRAFRAVVIDIQMPVMDGVTATREIRSFESRKRIEPRATILALTGLASTAARHECQKAGVNHFLPKPVKFKEFLKLLEE